MNWNKDELLLDLIYPEQRLKEAQSKPDDPDYRFAARLSECLIERRLEQLPAFHSTYRSYLYKTV